jgi:hypothetical protein
MLYHFEAGGALLFQRPDIRQNRIFILRSGATGVGKSLYFETWAAIINGSIAGKMNKESPLFNHALTAPPSELGSAFNGIFRDKKFVLFNEIGEKGEKHTNQLKALITNPTLFVNEKNEKAFTMDNYLLFAITTNEKFTHILDEDSRRETVYSIDRNSELVNELKDFYVNSDFFEWLNTPAARSALLDYYLNFDLKGYDGTQDAPFSKGKSDMANQSSVLSPHSDVDMYVEEELRGVPFIIVQKEYERFLASNPKSSIKKNMFSRKLDDMGYGKTCLERTNSQIHIGHISMGLEWPKRVVIRCYGKENVNCKDKDYISKILINRYYGGKLK